MVKIDFSKLMNSYTTDPTNIHKCSMYFPNTCAIRMSEAIVKAEPKYLDIFKASSQNKCAHSYIRGAQDLASILAKPTALGPRKYGWSGNSSSKAPTNVIGKKGIVCFMKIPGYSGQGHIDIWDKTAAIGSDYWDAETIWMWELS